MTDQSAGSASTQESSGQTETNPKKDLVAYDTYTRVLSEAKKLKEKVREYEAREQQIKEQELQKQNEWKTLADQYKTKSEEYSKKLAEQEQSIINGLKFQVFEKHLGGRLKDEEYVTHIPFDQIIVDPETKRVDEESVKGVVAEFTKKHSHLVEFAQGKMPNTASKPMSTSLNLNDLKTKQDIKTALALVLGKK